MFSLLSIYVNTMFYTITKENSKNINGVRSEKIHLDDVDFCILTGNKRNQGAIGKNEIKRKRNED